MPNPQVIVGLVGAIHPNMPGDDTGVYKRVMESMRRMQAQFGFELAAYEPPIKWEEDGNKARAFLESKQVDFTLLFCASLPFGRAVLPVVRVNSYLGIWSVPEPTTSGVLQLNSFCGLNMTGSIVAHYYNHYDIPFKWFYDYPETALFQERFAVTLRAMRAIKLLKNSRIGQIGELANGFENMHTDERVLEKKFGVYIQTRHTVEDIVARAKAYQNNAVAAELAKIQSEGSVCARVAGEDLEKMARLSLAFVDFAKEHNYNALAISCWSKFQEVYNVAVCAAMGRLNDIGIVAPCEADIAAATNMLIFRGLTGESPSLSDLVALDESDQSINLWHCGVAPTCWANANGVRWDAHFNIGQYDAEKQWHGRGVVADMQFKPGKVTIATMDNDFDRLFILTGDVMEKKAFEGSSGWVNHLKFNGEELTITDLINTISVNRVNHHYPTAYGDLTNELNEFANWKKMRILPKIPYTAYMQNPPF